MSGDQDLWSRVLGSVVVVAICLWWMKARAAKPALETTVQINSVSSFMSDGTGNVIELPAGAAAAEVAVSAAAVNRLSGKMTAVRTSSGQIIGYKIEGGTPAEAAAAVAAAMAKEGR